MGKPQSGEEADLEIKRFLKRVMHRDWKQQALLLLGLYGIVGSALCLLMQIVTLFVPFYYGGLMGGFLFLGALLAGAIHLLCRLAGEQKAARLADKAGLAERVSTSLEGRGKDSPIWVMQRLDTCQKIRGFSLKERMPYVLPWRQYVVTGSMLFLAFICFLFPSATKDEAKRKHVLAETVEKAEAEADKVKEQLEKQQEDGKLSAESRKKIEKALDTALKEMKDADDKQEISEAKERLETKLLRDLPQEMSKETAESLQPFVQDMNLAALAEYQQKLSELAKSNQAVAEAMDELKDLGEQLSSAEQNQLLDELSKLAQNGTLDSGQLSSALQNLQNANAQYASLSIQKNSQSASQQQNGNNSGQNDNAQNNDGQNDGGDTSTGENSQSGNQGGADGQNSQSGNAGGNNGQNGGAGQNNAGGNSQGTGGNGGGMNRGSANGMERENTSGDAETVWIPDSTGDDDNLTGQKTGSSKNRIQTKEGPARAGQKANIGSVSGQYSRKAYSKLNKQNVPESKQELVKKYFSGLE